MTTGDTIWFPVGDRHHRGYVLGVDGDRARVLDISTRANRVTRVDVFDAHVEDPLDTPPAGRVSWGHRPSDTEGGPR